MKEPTVQVPASLLVELIRSHKRYNAGVVKNAALIDVLECRAYRKSQMKGA